MTLRRTKYQSDTPNAMMAEERQKKRDGGGGGGGDDHSNDNEGDGGDVNSSKGSAADHADGDGADKANAEVSEVMVEIVIRTEAKTKMALSDCVVRPKGQRGWQRQGKLRRRGRR